jgi:hypothetical protein
LLETLDAWMRAKGFEKIDSAEAALLPPHSEAERGAFLLGNGSWTVLAYSDFEEEERLIFELSRSSRPFLRFFVVDSDVWAYQLYRSGEIVSAFVSKPGLWDDLPSGPNDIDQLRSVLRIAVAEPELKELQRQRGPLADFSALRFLNAIGLAPAMSQFDYLRENEFERRDFEVRELRYRRPGFDPMQGFDLHRITRRPPDLIEVREPQDDGGAEALLSFDVRLMLAASRILFFLLKPLYWISRPLILWRMRRAGGLSGNSGFEGGLREGVQPQRSLSIRDGIACHEGLGFLLRWPEGAVEAHGFEFFQWQGIGVSVRLLRPEAAREALAHWSSDLRIETEDLTLKGLPARIEYCEQSGPGGPRRWLSCHIATQRGVYAFFANFLVKKARKGEAPEAPRPMEELRLIVPILESFELAELEAARTST